MHEGIFFDATIELPGFVRSMRTHDPKRLVRRAVEVFSRMLDDHGDDFIEPIPLSPFKHIKLFWTKRPHSTAFATFLSGDVPLTTSVLSAGVDKDADLKAMLMTQDLIVKVDRMMGVRPRNGLASIRERPLIASIPLPFHPSEGLLDDLRMIADMETCLAAAFFEREVPARSPMG